MAVKVKVLFGQAINASSAQPEELQVSLDDSCTILEVKQRVAVAAGGQVRASKSPK